MTQPDSVPYMVRLVMKIDGKPDEPESAVINFVEMLVQNGMRDWVFRVENSETNQVIGYYDGYGDPVDMTPATPAATTDAPNTVVDPPKEEQSDESLVALAQSLNDGSPTPG